MDGPIGSHARELEYFLRHTWEFVIPPERSSETLEKGNYTWDFEYEVPGHWSESVEGLPHSWIIYRMKAKIKRGMLQQNTAVRKHLRIIRLLDPSSHALCRPLVRCLIVYRSWFLY
jgi:arrestin-related trafficking adapter 4/5/7